MNFDQMWQPHQAQHQASQELGNWVQHNSGSIIVGGTGIFSSLINRGTAIEVARIQQETALANLATQWELHKSNQNFQKEILQIQQAYSKWQEEYRQLKENERLEKRLEHEKKLEYFRRETQRLMAWENLLISLISMKEKADDDEIRKAYPLQTPQRVILDSYYEYHNSGKRIPPTVIISPIALEFEAFPLANAGKGFVLVGKMIADSLREMLAPYQPVKNPKKPVNYHGIDWKSKSFNGESAIKTLNRVLKSVPTLVIEASLVGDRIEHYLGWWDLMGEYQYEKVFSISWKEVLYPIAKKYARKWGEYKLTLLEKGRNIEELVTRKNRQNDELNFRILEEEEEDERHDMAEGIDYGYIVNEERYIKELGQFLSVCHCVLVGLAIDRYYFFNYRERPQLPELLPGLLAKIENEDLKTYFVEAVFNNCHNICELLVDLEPEATIDLALDLAVGFTGLDNKSWAKQMVCYSVNSWLKVRGVSNIDNSTTLLQLIDYVSNLKNEKYLVKRDYLLKIKNILVKLNEEYFIDYVQEKLNLFLKREYDLILEIVAEMGKCRLPVCIIAGATGSGKTTIANEIIRFANSKELNTSIILQEHGEVEVKNASFVFDCTDSSIPTEKEHSCICCSIEDDLFEAIYQVLETQNKIDYLILENAGIRDILPSALTFLDSELKDLTNLESIITLIDSSNFLENEDWFNSEAWLEKIHYADIILLNKTDLVREESLDSLEAKIRDIKQGAKILRCVNGQVPLPFISNLGLKYIDECWHYVEDGTISLVGFESNKPFAIRKFQDFLDNQIPDNLFRVIGMLWFDESPKRHFFTLSGKRFMLDDCEWKDKPNNKLVLIGQNLDAELIKTQLQECLVEYKQGET